MVTTSKGVAPFNGKEVLWLLDNADYGIVPVNRTELAWVIFGYSEAGRAEPDMSGNTLKALCQRLHLRGGLQEVKSKPEGGLLTDPRQLF